MRRNGHDLTLQRSLALSWVRCSRSAAVPDADRLHATTAASALQLQRLRSGRRPISLHPFCSLCSCRADAKTSTCSRPAANPQSFCSRFGASGILTDSIIDDLIADHRATAQANKGKCARKKKKKKMRRQRSGAPNVDQGDGPSTVAADEPSGALADSVCDALDHEHQPYAQPAAESSAEAVLVGATQQDAGGSPTTRAMLPDIPVPATCDDTDDDVASISSAIPSSTPRSTARNVTVANDVPSTEADDPQSSRVNHDDVVNEAGVLGTRNVRPLSRSRSVVSLWHLQGQVATPEATGIISAQRRSQDLQLAVDLDDFIAAAKVAREYDARYRQWALHRVTSAVKTMFPMAVVLEVGSAPAGLHLAAPISDVDVVVANVSDTGAGLVRLFEHLKRDPAFCDVVHIARASTPVVKMTLTGTTLSVDVAWNAPFVAESRAFVLASSRRHRMFAPLVMYLKYYLYMHGLGTPFYGGVGSFLLYVLVRSHLQVPRVVGRRVRRGH